MNVVCFYSQGCTPGYPVQAFQAFKEEKMNWSQTLPDDIRLKIPDKSCPRSF